MLTHSSKDLLAPPSLDGQNNGNNPPITPTPSFLKRALQDPGSNESWELCKHHNQDLFTGPDRLVLEQSVWPRMNWRVGLREFLLHASFPLSLPFYLKNWSLGNKQLYFTWRIILLPINQLIMQPLAWVLVFWFYSEREKLRDDGVYDIEVMSAIVCILAHRACIALKYSFLTDAEYQEFLTAKPETAGRWLSNMQILTAWVQPELPVVAYEVWSAARQLNVKLVDLQVYIHASQSEAFASYLSITQPEFDKILDVQAFEKDDTTVSVMQLIVASFLTASSGRVNRAVAAWCMCAALVRSLLFGFARSCTEGESFLGHSLESAIIIICSIVLVFNFYLIVLRLITANICDMHRRLQVGQDISDFIRISACKRPGHPRIQMELTDNIRAWVCLRRIVRRVGSRYRKRASVYNKVGNIVCVAFVLEAIVLFGWAHDVTDLKTDARFIQSLVDITLIGLPLIVNIFLGSKVNQQIHVDVEALISHRIAHRFHAVEKRQVRRKSVAPEANSQALDQFLIQIEYDDACDDLLDTAIQALEGMDRDPVTMFGIRSDTRLLTSVVTLLGTVTGYLIQRVYFPNR